MARKSSSGQGDGRRQESDDAGGARKKKMQDWEHQAVHRVSSLDKLKGPVAVLYYRQPSGKTPAESIYLFDQEAAKGGITYYTEYRQTKFHIWVGEKNQKETQRIIDRLNPKSEPKRSPSLFGRWSSIEPTRLSKTYQDHPWVFADYREFGNDRDDGLSYVAFLFRNRDRTLLGIKKWLGKDVLVKHDILEKMAYQVVVDGEFRRSLISNDPALPILWKKH